MNTSTLQLLATVTSISLTISSSASFALSSSSEVQLSRYGVYNYVFAYVPREWTLQGADTQWETVDYENDPDCDNILKVYTFSVNATKPFARYRIHILRNKGYSVTWLPELYPFVCNTGFGHEIVEYPHQAVSFNHPFRIPSLFTEEEIAKDSVRFETIPELPDTVKIDPATGDIMGYFVGTLFWTHWVGIRATDVLFLHDHCSWGELQPKNSSVFRVVRFVQWE